MIEHETSVRFHQTHIWRMLCRHDDGVSELSAKSNYATGLNFAPAAASFNEPKALALDASGNIFFANYDGDSVSELLGLAKPVGTPLQKNLPP